MSEKSQENYQVSVADPKFEAFAQLAHVLVIDDDRRIRDLLTRYLTEQQFVVIAAADAREAKILLRSYDVDVIVVDVMMPGETGLEFTASYRLESSTPIILLTALGETHDRIAGLEVGADDYLAKPFEPRELVLRLNAILKRTAKRLDHPRKLQIGEWVYDPNMDQISTSDDTIKLTNAESVLVQALARDAGEVVSRDDLAKRCGVDAGERTIDVQVTRLRRKIEQDTKNPRYLQTVRGKGYILRAEVL